MRVGGAMSERDICRYFTEKALWQWNCDCVYNIMRGV